MKRKSSSTNAFESFALLKFSMRTLNTGRRGCWYVCTSIVYYLHWRFWLFNWYDMCVRDPYKNPISQTSSPKYVYLVRTYAASKTQIPLSHDIRFLLNLKTSNRIQPPSYQRNTNLFTFRWGEWKYIYFDQLHYNQVCVFHSIRIVSHWPYSQPLFMANKLK